MTIDDHRRLAEVESRLAEITAERRRLEAERDAIILRQTDLEGADDRRFVAAR